MIVNSEHALITISTQVLKKYEEEDGRYLICGTNAYKPECRDYVEVVFTFEPEKKNSLAFVFFVKDGDTYLMTKKSKGVGLCPYRFFIIDHYCGM